MFPRRNAFCPGNSLKLWPAFLAVQLSGNADTHSGWDRYFCALGRKRPSRGSHPWLRGKQRFLASSRPILPETLAEIEDTMNRRNCYKKIEVHPRSETV